jgi:hypothetical protein
VVVVPHFVVHVLLVPGLGRVPSLSSFHGVETLEVVDNSPVFADITSAGDGVVGAVVLVGRPLVKNVVPV